MPVEELAQVVVGRDRVAHLELHGRADLDLVAHGDRADVAVAAEHGADEEVAAVEVDLVLVDDAAEVDPALGERAVVGLELLEQVDQALERGPCPRARRSRVRSLLVTVSGWPIGRQPCETTLVASSCGASSAPTAPSVNTLSSSTSRLPPGPRAADASPPTTRRPG